MSTAVPDRQTRLAIAARVPCDPRVVAKYYDPSRGITLVCEANIRRVLAELGLPDPRPRTQAVRP